MTKVYCYNNDCVYLDTCSGLCNAGVVSIGDGFEGGCDTFVPYYNNAEYGEKFFIAVGERGKASMKAVRYGKRIEYNGRTFYTTDRITDDGIYGLTDKRTGLYVAKMYQLEGRWERFLELEKNLPDVESYPLAEYDKSGKYKIVEEKAEGKK